MGTHLRVLSKSYPMNTNMTGFRWFSKIFSSLCLMDENILGRVIILVLWAVSIFLQRRKFHCHFRVGQGM